MTEESPISHVAVVAPPPPPTPKAHGIDISSWQHPGGRPIDWKLVAEDGVTFVMVKASQGDTYVNPYLEEDVLGAHAEGLIVGAYHYFVPGVDATKQADTFVGACVGHVLELGAYIDWEPPEMPDWEATSQYNALREKISEARRPVGVYLESWWHAAFVRMGLGISRLWTAGNWTGDLPIGTTIVQGKTEPVGGIIGAVDSDALVSVRGIDIPRPAKPAEQPFVAAGEAAEKATEPAEGSSADLTADAALGSPPQ